MGHDGKHPYGKDHPDHVAPRAFTPIRTDPIQGYDTQDKEEGESPHVQIELLGVHVSDVEEKKGHGEHHEEDHEGNE